MKKMKRFLLLIVMGFITTQFLNAQVIELIGKGVHEVNPSTLTITDPGSVEKVVVVADAIFRDSIQPADVQFSDDNESYTASFTPTTPNLAQPFIINDPTQKFGYYTATFNTVDADGEITLNNFGQQEQVISFMAYVYRTGDSPNVYSEVKGDHAFLFRLGSGFPVIYNFTIPSSTEPRNVTVTVPFSDLVSNDLRWAHVSVSAGAATVTSEFDTNNSGALLHLETITIPNVPGDVTEVTVTIYSPNLAIDDKNGDSFITGPVVLSTTYNVGGGCTLTQGYWKTHSIYGPAGPADETWDLVGGPDAMFFLSGQTYLEVLNTAPGGNKYYILAHQYIAAELNFLAGADNSEVIDAFNQAKTLLQMYTPAEIAALKGKDGKDLTNQYTSLGSILDDYNNGIIGPGHCGEEYEMMEKSAQITDENNGIVVHGFKVYPNPVMENSTVSFSPSFDGNATVELYNIMGQKTTTLFNRKVQKDIPVSFSFDGRQYTQGLYLMVVKNGQGKETTKIEIR
jgi:hypothetical protein